MSSEAEILHEAKMLREHKDRLESRMKLLEVHNNQLEMQLGKLRTILNSDGTPMVTNGNTHPSITSNKTGTLNTKSVTASQLATNSPVLPHKLNGNGPAPPSRENGRGDPPALPPRGVSVRSASNKPPPPAVPPKRSSLTRSDLALFENVSTTYQEMVLQILIFFSHSLFQNRTNSLPRGLNNPSGYPTAGSNPRARDFSLTRMSSLNNGQYGGGPSSSATMAGGGGHWTDSLPRRDFYSNIAPTGTQISCYMLKSAEKYQRNFVPLLCFIMSELFVIVGTRLALFSY